MAGRLILSVAVVGTGLLIMRTVFHVPDASLPEQTVPLPLPDGAERVCLSLRVLSEHIAEAASTGEPLSEEVLTLGGIGLVEGFVVDEAGKDVILIGQRSARPTLHLDDLVANARNVASGIQHPYCSLDPIPADVLALEHRLSDVPADLDASEVEAYLHGFEALVGPQEVVVGGVPRRSRHAHVMIDADYHVKKVFQGQITLPRFPSYLDRSLAKTKAAIRESGKPHGSQSSMSRIWFHVGPDGPKLQESDKTVWLAECPVVLLTARQMVSGLGELYDGGEDDPLAVSFAEEFSILFAEFAEHVPSYAELENLYRLRAVLLAMQFRGALESVGMDLQSLVGSYEYRAESPMPDSLPGLVNGKRASVPVDGAVWNSFPIVCGGVDMEIQVTHSTFDTSKQPRLLLLQRGVFTSRPSQDQTTWPVGGHGQGCGPCELCQTATRSD